MKRQRGAAITLILLLMSAGLGISLYKPVAGTYTFIPSGFAILKMDTRDGSVQRCFLKGNVLTCEDVKDNEQTETQNGKRQP